MGMRAFVILVAALAAVAASGVSHAGSYRPPRNADGHPDLEGTWSSMSNTRLERPPGAPLTFPTMAQEETYEAEQRTAVKSRRDTDPLGGRDSEWQAEFPLARMDGKLRTSWIVSPADGRLPYRPGKRERLDVNLDRADGPEDRGTTERCLVGGQGAAGPPIQNPTTTSGGTQIVQTRDEVAILAEMNHDVRIVRLNGRHQSAKVRQWMGDAIGWWEGDTLVVETVNFHPQETDHARYLISPDARVTERFRRVSASELRYTFEVDDPANYTVAWRGEMPLMADNGRIYEYACHEGNYGLTNILAGARQVEQEKAATQQPAP